MIRLRTDDAWTGKDKALHFLGGLTISLAVALLSAAGLGLEPYPAQVLGMAVAAAVAWAKEVWDFYHPPHDPSVQDAVVTMAGAAAGMLVAWGLMSFA